MAAEVARRSYGSDVRVAELQRGRLLDATFALVYELGYANVTAHKISERAGVSSRTFYELFRDREDCFLAAFDYALDTLAEAAKPAYGAELDWVERVRAGLTVLLDALDREPAVGRLVFVEALAAGPRSLERRARALAELAVVVDEGRADAPTPVGLPALAAEATVGATFSVIHARLLGDEQTRVAELLNGLMATIVLPYRGGEAATRELERSLPSLAIEGSLGAGMLAERPLGSSSPVDFRLTIRTQLALAAVAEYSARGSYPSNREVSEQMGLHDQGQVSRLMGRMQAQGLVENTRSQTQASGKGLAKAWRLTPHGKTVLEGCQGEGDVMEALRNGGGGDGKLPTKRGLGDKNETAAAGVKMASPAFRLTALTHQVLRVVVSSSAEGGNPGNRDIARAAGGRDEGQISHLLTRLQDHGMLENTGGPTDGANAWRLTPRGEEILHSSQVKERTA
jgi:AcrR family transcriptional regulator/DNA-binding MarR family transcriptional regulator